MPLTSIPSAKGFSDCLSLQMKDWIYKREDGFDKRTFIQPTQEQQKLSCERKFKISEEIKGKDVYLIDDSIVRGNTLKTIIKILREFGVGKIHVRIMSPVIRSLCYFGINMAQSRENLVGYSRTVEEIRKILEVDTLRFLSVDTLKSILGHDICTSCFDGQYDPKLVW